MRGNAGLVPFRLTCRRLRDVADTCVYEVAVAVHPEHGAWQVAALQRYKAVQRLHMDVRDVCDTSAQLCALVASIVHGCRRLGTLQLVCGVDDAEDWAAGGAAGSGQLSATLGSLCGLQSLRVAGSGAHVTSSQVLAEALRCSSSLQVRSCQLCVRAALCDWKAQTAHDRQLTCSMSEATAPWQPAR